MDEKKTRIQYLKAILLISFAAPTLGELATILLTGKLGPAAVPSFGLSLLAALLYFGYLWTQRLGLFILLAVLAMTLMFSVSVLYNGGLLAEHFVFIAIFPLVYGLLIGKRGLFLVVVYLVPFTLLCYYLKDSSYFQMNQKIVNYPLLVFQTLNCLAFMSILFFWSQRLRDELLVKNSAMAAEISKTSRLLQTALDHMPGPVYSKGIDGKYLFINDKFHEAVKLPDNCDVTKMTDMDMYPESTWRPLMENDREIVRTGKTLHFEEQVPHPDGTIHHYDTYKFPLIDDEGSIFSVTGISIDITDKVKMQEQLDQERAKLAQSMRLATLGEMAAGVAHEINNPLAIIAGSVGVLGKYADNPAKIGQSLPRVQRSIDRIEKIINGLKRFARQSEDMQTSEHRIDFIIEESIDLTMARAHREGVEVKLKQCESGLIQCDDIQIEQVLVNLINNAIDANIGGESPWVEVSVHTEGPEVEIIVKDSGHGIAGGVAEKIFYPFFTTKPVGKGTGLGLSISKGIAQQHGGDLGYRVIDGHTSFVLKLPLVGV